MAGNIAAAEGAILRGADTVAGTRQDLDFRIKTIEGQMIAIGSNWQGMGAVSFQQLMTAWNEDARKVTNALVQLEDSLRRTQQEYDTTDEDQNLTFTKVTQRLGGIR
ncbi:MAG: WXG100 family type VII secretion target [Actinomyces dentalis]|jgi:WXG100 family type VII secretion target